jgi:N-methylhydantoinase A/oxoprolinase/acetone carboxylase beta subunit
VTGRELDLRLGIDVGGTHTDAVVLDRDDRVLAKTKQPTTADVTSGIVAAIGALVIADGVDPRRISHVMLGTTHATNAVLERRELLKVAVVRIGAPSTTLVRPLYPWPADLRQIVSAGEVVVAGGVELDGRDIVAFDPDATARFLESVAGSAQAVAITGVFSPISARQELEAEAVARKVLGPDVPISLSHEIGSLGLLEREHATVLNAALSAVAEAVASALKQALVRHQLDAVAFFAQNDGTLMALEYAISHPVLTIGSGPANSIRGAAYLTSARDALIADIGGTSTDIGILTAGFPRETAAAVEIGGVRTNFRMPDLVTIAVGGGSVVASDSDGVRVGPESVGYRLQDEALIFGGDTTTLTDAAVHGGRTSLGRLPASADASLLRRGLERADWLLADAVDRIKIAAGEPPLIVVGGGSVIMPDSLPGVGEIVRPEHFEVANAIGAAIATVSGQVDRVYALNGRGREAALEEARTEACEHAVRAGADSGRVEIVALEEVPLAYLTTPAIRVRAKAVGPLSSV